MARSRFLTFIGRTAARRVVWIVVGLLVSAVLSAFGVAHAQSTPTFPESGTYPTEGEAWAACRAYAARLPGTAHPPGTLTRCADHSSPGDKALAAEYQTYEGQGWQLHHGYWRWAKDCSAGGRMVYRVNHSLVIWRPLECMNGCEYAPSDQPSNCTTITSGANIGNNCWYDAYPTGAVCEASPPEDGRGPDDNGGKCPAGQTQLPDGSCKPQGDCPVGQHKSANGTCQPNGSCPTGQVKGPDGSCNPEGCPAGQAKGQDGTCKDDEDGDGNPDDEGGNGDGKEFSGGDDCKVPPRCSGDAIMCGQARIQWRIDCNTRKNRTLTGGNGCGPGGTPVCTGEKCDPIETAQLVQAWKTACALAEQEGGTGGGSGPVQPEWTKVGGMSNNPGQGEGDGDAPGVKGGTATLDDVDTGGWTGGGSCMGFIAGGGGSGGINEGFIASMSAPPPWFCEGVGWFKALNIMLAALGVAYMLSGRSNA